MKKNGKRQRGRPKSYRRELHFGSRNTKEKEDLHQSPLQSAVSVPQKKAKIIHLDTAQIVTPEVASTNEVTKELKMLFAEPRIRIPPKKNLKKYSIVFGAIDSYQLTHCLAMLKNIYAAVSVQIMV